MDEKEFTRSDKNKQHGSNLTQEQREEMFKRTREQLLKNLNNLDNHDKTH